MGKSDNTAQQKKKRANSVLKPSKELIPIKGISLKMRSKLEELNIMDISTLLSRCNTQNKRDKLAEELEIAPEYVNSWVKQADLWRVENMTTDMAFMLVQIGVRSVDDLSKVDSNKAYPILKSVSLTNPEYELVSKSLLDKLIGSATDIVESSLNLIKLKENINGILNLQNVDDDVNLLSQLLNTVKSESNKLGFTDDEPTYLFKSQTKHSNESLANKLSAAWKDLFEMDCILPLPKTISGTVKERSMNSNAEPIPFEGVKVEIEGIVSPAEDKTEAAENPSCITDSTGRFIITLPERYSFKETVKIIISNSKGKQVFVKNSTEVINALEETDVVNALQDILCKRIAYREAFANSNDKNSKNDINNLKKEFEDAIGVLTNKDSKYKKKLDELGITKYVESLKNISIDSEDKAFDKLIKQIFDIILLRATLDAHIEGVNITSDDDSFIVIKEIFTSWNGGLQKSLPSVKLMGDDENPVMLSTDTAPTRMYTYSMLQRLIEPKLGKKLDNSIIYEDATREAVNEPIDIYDIKDNLCVKTDNFKQMSSLGLGYQLNMHQAWIPDGFALGDLLYSLILAPGEEQRLVVRENKQTYQITDTAEGSDIVTEDYLNNQTDDTSAVYDYAVSQLMDANSSYKSSSSGWNVGGSASATFFASGGLFGIGLSGGYSSSSSSGSSAASQHNSHNEASSAAQQFQQKIKTSSNRLAQAKRLSVSIASSEVSDSVATKIVANHNHSHAMTIQYWEVMRRYCLETAIDSVDLVLFVPLKLVNFLGNETDADECKFIYDFKDFDKTKFGNRYDKLIKHANALEGALPYKYRTGLNLIRKYAAIPNWTIETKNESQKTLNLNFKGNFLSFDNFSATLYLKNGKGCIGGDIISYVPKEINDLFANDSSTTNSTNSNTGATTNSTNSNTGATTSDELKRAIRKYRNSKEDIEVGISFTLPIDVVDDDISNIQINHILDPLNYSLIQNEDDLEVNEKIAWEKYKEKVKHLAQDNDNSDGDIRDIEHYLQMLPEAFRNRNVKFDVNTLRSLGNPTIHSINFTCGVDDKINEITLSHSISSAKISNKAIINISTSSKTLRYSEIEKMEETLHHITTDPIRYSQAIWSALTSDERVMLFDRYTIDMDFSKLRKFGHNSSSESVNVPLLNCINVRKMLGFYGNCMLFPFTFPKELADILGRSSLEVQDQLYRYHTNSFRAPTTVISMPTKGMIGEAVLGQTNVSEVIDLTRFWNWQDSPIDKMEITNEYLNGQDYLNNKKTTGITSLGLDGVTATEAATATNLLSALIAKQTPSFTNLTGLEQLAGIIKSNTDSAAAGRENVVNKSTEAVTKNLDVLQKMDLAQKINDLEKEKITHVVDGKLPVGVLSETPFATLGSGGGASGGNKEKAKPATGNDQAEAGADKGKDKPAAGNEQAEAGANKGKAKPSTGGGDTQR